MSVVECVFRKAAAQYKKDIFRENFEAFFNYLFLKVPQADYFYQFIMLFSSLMFRQNL